MAKKQPMYGSEASTDNAAIPDVATTAAAEDSYGFAEAQANALVSSVNSIIAALEKFGIIKT
jgi:hypothetical protein